MKTLYLTNKLRKYLENPPGQKIFGTKKEVSEKLKKIIEKNNFEKIISIGDYCSFNIPSDVKIFDGRIRRNKKFQPQKHTLFCKNPPASINKDVWPIIEKGITANKNIFVKGEEDLLVIPSILSAKEGSAILFGVPKKGISLIKASLKEKNEFKKLLKKFRSEKFKKAIMGGTFDRLHSGHQYFLSMAEYYTKEVLVGITSDKIIKRKENYKKIQSFEIRRKNVENYLKKIKLKNKIVKIENIYGPSTEEKTADAILLTEETLKNGIKINKIREKNQLTELNYIILPYITDKKGKKISSSDIRKSI